MNLLGENVAVKEEEKKAIKNHQDTDIDKVEKQASKKKKK